jgi:hypothetical protein
MIQLGGSALVGKLARRPNQLPHLASLAAIDDGVPAPLWEGGGHGSLARADRPFSSFQFNFILQR